jgi:hypothetical protein
MKVVRNLSETWYKLGRRLIPTCFHQISAKFMNISGKWRLLGRKFAWWETWQKLGGELVETWQKLGGNFT